MTQIISPTMPKTPQVGDRWLHTLSGLTFEYQATVGGHRAWVQVLVPGFPPMSTTLEAPVITNNTPKVTSSPLAPDTSDPCDLWYHTETGVFFIRYDDGSTVQWVTTQPTKVGDIIVVTGPAGGDLAGSYPNPTIKDDVELTGVPTLETPPAPNAAGNEIVTADWVLDITADLAADIAADIAAINAALALKVAKAGDTMTGVLVNSVGVTVGQGAVGKVQMAPGGASQSGYVGFFDAAGVRVGYTGWGSTTVQYVADKAASYHEWFGPGPSRWGSLQGGTNSATFVLNNGSAGDTAIWQIDSGGAMYVRPQKAGSTLYLGAGGANTAFLQSTGIYPITTQTQALGNANFVWLNVWSAAHTISNAAGTSRYVSFQTAGSERWRVQATVSAESGSNAGSNFSIDRSNDAGVYIDTPFSINRATGIVAFSQTPTMPTATVGDSSTKGATTAFVGAALTALNLGTTYVAKAGDTMTGPLIGTIGRFSSMAVGTGADPTVTLDVGGNVNAAVTAKIGNTNTGAAAQSILQQSVAGRFVNRVIDYTQQYLHEIGSAIATRYSDFNTHIFRNTAGAEQARIASNTLTVIGSASDAAIMQVDAGGQTYVRGQKAGAYMYLGAAATNSVLISSGGAFPVTHATHQLGNVTNTWAAVWSVQHVVNGAAGTIRPVYFDTAGSARWVMGASATAEGGSNAGSDFFINRHNDAGVYLDTPFSINRATGATTITRVATLRADLSQTWNAAGTNFETIFANITDTAEAGSSRLLHFQRNGSDTFAVDKYGTLITGGGIYNGDVVQSWGAHKANVNSAPPAGGDLTMGQFFSNVANFGVMFGTGAPNKAAAAGTLYLRRDGAPQYNADGTAGGWVGIGAGGAWVGTAAPPSPTAGQLWWQTDLGQMFVYYNDGNTTQWVPASPAVGTELTENFQVVAASGSFSMNNNFTSIFRSEVPPSTVLDVGGNVQTNLGGTNVLGFSAVRPGKWMFTAEAFFNGADGMHVVALWHQTSAGATIQIYEQGNVNNATGIGTVTSAIINVAAGDRVFPFWATSGTGTVIAGVAGAVGGFGSGAKLCKFLGQRLAY